MDTIRAMNKAEFVERITPLAEKLRGLDLNGPGATAAVGAAAPLDSELVRDIMAAATGAIDSDWLLPKENGDVRFGRVAKELCGFSIDAVWMQGPGPKHRHPNGEIDLCIGLDGEPTFDGKPAGWVVYGPGSVHVPTVKGGTMLILYFLPGGAIDFL